MVVRIKEHDIKLGFGLYFLGKAQKKGNTDLNGLLQSLIKNPIADMVDLMYYSAICEAELDDIQLPISKRDFVEYLEQTKDFEKLDGLVARWSNKFMETIKGNFLPEAKDSEEVVKKK